MRIYKFVIFLNDLGKKILNSVPNLYTTKFTGNRVFTNNLFVVQFKQFYINIGIIYE